MAEVNNPYDNLNGQLNVSNQYYVAKRTSNEKAGQSLDMTDFLTLMVAMFQNQDIDNPADTTAMMTQMVQMSVIQAITDISQLISDSTNMTYGASLIGKEVTIGVYNSDFTKLDEITGVVTGTGQQDGKQVVFLGDKTYLVSDIMAVGRLPAKEDDSTTDDKKPGDSTSGGTTTTTPSGSTDTVTGDLEDKDPAEDSGADVAPEE